MGRLASAPKGTKDAGGPPKGARGDAVSGLSAGGRNTSGGQSGSPSGKQSGRPVRNSVGFPADRRDDTNSPQEAAELLTASSPADNISTKGSGYDTKWPKTRAKLPGEDRTSKSGGNGSW